MRISLALGTDNVVRPAAEITPDLRVPDFGIRVTANSLARSGLPGGWLTGEWLAALTGGSDDDLARGMTASQLVRVDLTGPAGNVRRLLLDRYHATTFRQRFPFLDILHPITGQGNVIAQLDLTVEHRVRTGLHDHFGWTPNPSRVIHSYRIQDDGTPTESCREPTLAWVRDHLLRSGSGRVPRLWVQALDSTGEVVQSRPLRDYITAELRHRGEVYVLASGRWFLVDRDRLARLEAHIAEIPHAGFAVPFFAKVNLAHGVEVSVPEPRSGRVAIQGELFESS